MLGDQVDETALSSLPLNAVIDTADNGLQVHDFRVGRGESPSSTDTVRVGYVGYLPDGTVFDSSEGIDFPLTNLIQGFSEGVQGMNVGGIRRIIIPPDIGYGPGGNPGAGIGGEDIIVFDVTLLGIV